jgi:hypothetical protein
MSSIESKVNSTQLGECQGQITHLSSRVSATSSKISQIEGVSQALTIKSAPTFPKVEPISSKLFEYEPSPARPEVKFHIQDHHGNPPNVSVEAGLNR